MDEAASISRRRAPFIPAIAAILALIVLAAGATRSAKASEEAEQFIRESIAESFAIVNNAAYSEAERGMRFRDFMLTLSDFRRIAIFTIGPYADRAGAEELDAFVDAFTEYTAAIYLKNLEGFQGRTVSVLGSADRAADDFVVNAEVVDPNDTGTPAAQVAFRVRIGGNANLIVIDMEVGGVWLAITQRDDFTSYLRRNGGSLALLTDRLHETTSEIQSS